MKKFINDVDDILTESLRGFSLAHEDIVSLSPDPFYIYRKEPAKSKVALISGGGSGHEPLHAGFVGKGMLDAACPGQVFTSPTPDQMLAAAEATDNGEGVLFIVKNYSGDLMNFEMAAEMYADIKGGECLSVITNDDVAVEDSAHTTGRRGVAGTVVVEKIVGAAAEAGKDLKTCQALGQLVNANTRSMGVAFSSCTVPAAGSPTFTLHGDEMEMGVGIHGEAGRKRVPIASADKIAEELMEAILADLKPSADIQALLMVNGFGGTPYMELALMYDAARRVLDNREVTVVRSLVGNYVTSLEMAGCSFTLSVLNNELLSYWDDPVHTAALRWRA